MCMECRMNPCHPRCPNAEPHYFCCVCGEEITGNHYDYDGDLFCIDCQISREDKEYRPARIKVGSDAEHVEYCHMCEELITGASSIIDGDIYCDDCATKYYDEHFVGEPFYG